LRKLARQNEYGAAGVVNLYETAARCRFLELGDDSADFDLE